MRNRFCALGVHSARSAHSVGLQQVLRTRTICKCLHPLKAQNTRPSAANTHTIYTLSGPSAGSTHSVGHRQVPRTRWVFNRFCTLDPALQVASAYSHAASPGSRQISRMKIARHNSRKTKQPEVTTPTGQAHDTTAARQNSPRTRHPHDSPKTNSPKQKQTPPHTATRPA